MSSSNKNPRCCLPIYYRAKDCNEPALIEPSSFRLSHRWVEMKSNISLVRQWRCQLPDTCSSEDPTYASVACKFVSLNEGVRLFPYRCSREAITVGVGLLLRRADDPVGTKEKPFFQSLAVNAFASIGRDLEAEYSNHPELLEQQIKEKIPIITGEESEKLLNFVLERNREQMIRKYFPIAVWNSIPSGIRIALESLYYQCPIYVDGTLSDAVNRLVRARQSNGSENSASTDSIHSTLLFDIARRLNRGAPFALSVDGLPAKSIESGSDWEGIMNRRWREMIMSTSAALEQRYFPEVME